MANFRNEGWIDSCQGFGMGARGVKGERSGYSYEKATRGILGMMELFSISTVMIDTGFL